MTPARWQAVTKIFEAALEQPQTRREAYVQQACAQDAELHFEVAKLLNADSGAGSFLEHPAVSPFLPSTFAPSSSLLATGSVVSERFEILRFIGQGGMGQVYEALDLELKSRVALKAIRPEISSDLRALSRFRREVHLTRLITHPNVCRTFDIDRHPSAHADGSASDITFLTMELLEGETLAAFLRREGRLSSAQALPLVLQMVAALQAAHAVGVVHRDFKPSNVLLVPALACSRVVVTDFGLARAIQADGQHSQESLASSLTGSQGLIGTLAYMAPEQFERGEASIASDIYSLGLVLFEMVTGQRPFSDPIPFAEAVKRLKQSAPSAHTLLPELDPAWEVVIRKSLEIQPKDRFASVMGVAEGLSQGLTGAVPPRLCSDASSSEPPSTPSGSWPAGKQLPPQDATRIPPSFAAHWRKPVAALALLTALVALSAALLRHYLVRSNAQLAGGATVLLTDIHNATGDPRFDSAGELIRRQLFQSPYFNLMDSARVRDVLTQMTKSPDAPMDPPTAREVAMRTGAPRIIFGNLSRVGDSYILDMDIEQPDNNPQRYRANWENHWTWSLPSASPAKEIPAGFLSVVRDSSDWVRSQIGESANDIARVDAPPEDVTTGNWEALSEYSQAEKFQAGGRSDDAAIALENAVAADPQFALAYMRLGDTLISLSRYSEGYGAYQKALAQERRQRLTRREKDRLEGLYAIDTEDFKTAEAAFRDYSVYYPLDYLGWFYRASPLMMMGRVEEAIATLKKAVDVDPTRVSAPAHIARYDMILGDFQDSSQWIQHLRANAHFEDATVIEGQLKFLQGNYEEALAHFAQLRQFRRPLYLSDSYALEARVYAETGQYENAVQALDHGIAADLAAGDLVHRADKLLDRAYINLKRKRYDSSIDDTKLALTLDHSPQRSMTAGSILGCTASEVGGQLRIQIALELRKLELGLPKAGLWPIEDIVSARLRGEALLAEGNTKLALAQFLRADNLQAPVQDRSYLARGLLAVAKHTPDASSATQFKKHALSADSNLAFKPGQIWEWPQNFPPGRWADAIFAYGSLADELQEFDPHAIALLTEYLVRHDNADAGLFEVGDAKRMLSKVH